MESFQVFQIRFGAYLAGAKGMNTINTITNKTGPLDLSRLPDSIENEFNPKTFSKILIKGILAGDEIDHITEKAFKKLPRNLQTDDNRSEVEKLVHQSIQNLLPHVDSKTADGFLKINPEMASAKDIGAQGITFIKKYEDFASHLYDKDGAKNGNTTIGYGHLVHAGPIDGRNSETEFKNGITREQADKLFVKDVQKYIDAVNLYVKVPLSQSQFDALVSFSYNAGIGRLEGPGIKKVKGFCNSELLTLVNNGEKDPEAIKKAFAKWRFSDKKEIDGLVLRRKDESEIFLNGEYNRTDKGWLRDRI